MLRIDFNVPLTALEIREPLVAECKLVASAFGLFANFQQPQQQAYERSLTNGARSVRIGNGKHKSWRVDYQTDPTNVSNPNVVGRIILKSHNNPNEVQYGGFDYGRYASPAPLYPFISVYTPSELKHFNAIDPDPEILKMTCRGLVDIFKDIDPRLF